MNCRDIEPLLLAERDGVLTDEQHATLGPHVALCPACQQMRARLTEAMTAFRADAATVAVPDVEKEWQILRAQLPSHALRSVKKRPLAPVIWFGSSLAAAAALALAYVSLQQPAQPPQAQPVSVTVAAVAPGTESARADYVEAGDSNASTMVYVDKDSGWLVVWATDSGAKNSG